MLMSDLFVYVLIAVVAIAGAGAWLYFPKPKSRARDRQGSPTLPRGLTRSLPAQRKSRPVHHRPHIERRRRLRRRHSNGPIVRATRS